MLDFAVWRSSTHNKSNFSSTGEKPKWSVFNRKPKEKDWRQLFKELCYKVTEKKKAVVGRKGIGVRGDFYFLFMI